MTHDPHDANCDDTDCAHGWVQMTEDDKLYVLPCRTCQPLKWRIFHETVGQPELRTKRLQANFGIAASWTHDGGIDSQIKQWTGA